MDLAAVIVVALIFAVAGALIAVRMKNRSPWLGALLGFLLGLIGIGILLILPKARPADEWQDLDRSSERGRIRDPRTGGWGASPSRDPGWPPPPARPPSAPSTRRWGEDER